MTQLALKNLSKSFGAFKVLDGLNLEADAGEIVVVFGGSGTGKTILLRMIAGVELPTGGSIELDGHDVDDIAPEHRNVGMAFQNFALFPHMSASENIGAALVARNANADVVQAGIKRVAKLLKIDHVLSHAPRELSNGQKQRTSLARALAAEPRILLLDDPLRNVDAKLRFEMRLELPRLLRQSGATVLYVTQDYKEAMALGDRIAVLQNGKFVQLATPEEIYNRPATLEVAKLFGDPVINTFEHMRNGKPVIKAVRPDAVLLGARKDAMAAKIMAITPLNERTVLLLQSESGQEFLASLPSSVPTPKSGAKVQASFAVSGTHYFDKETGARIDG